MDLLVSVDAVDTVSGLSDLHAWLRREPEFRGRVEMISPLPTAGELGSLPDVLSVAVGSGGALTALAASLKMFLSQPRRSDVRMTVKTSDGRSVELDAKRVDDVEALVQNVFTHLHDSSE